MNKKELQILLDELKIHPSRKLGQNFLLDKNLLEFISKAAAPKKGELIIEIGPGLGSLTKLLLKSESEVIAIEYDSRLVEYLSKNITSDKFRLIHHDAIRFNFNEIIPKNKAYRIVANLPYSITTPLIASFLTMPDPPDEMLFLVQKEAAERLAAGPNNKSYGSITVLVQNIYKVEYLRTISPEVFYPMPIVDSALIKFSKKYPLPTIEERKFLKTIVKTAFSKRRKKMINNLRPILKTVDLEAIFEKLSLNQNIRAENLSPKEFLSLAKLCLY